jgi:hypothetical protein
MFLTYFLVCNTVIVLLCRLFSVNEIGFCSEITVEEYAVVGLLFDRPSFKAIVWKSIRLKKENFLEINAISGLVSLHPNYADVSSN